MRKTLIIGVLVLVLSIPLGGVASAHGTTQGPKAGTQMGTQMPAHPQVFVAYLSGDQQVPPVTTSAQGLAIIWMSPDGKTLHYHVLVANLKDATMAHIHLGKAGTNGPVVVTLFHSMTPVSTTGVLAAGTATASQLEGPLAGHPLSDLLAAMTTGGAYVNVHTKQHPDGETRGPDDAARVGRLLRDR